MRASYEPQLAWVAPAQKDDPFKLIAAVSYKDEEVPVTQDNDDEDVSGKPAAKNAQMAEPGAQPDVEPEADARGKVKNVSRPKRVQRAQLLAPHPAAAPTPKPRNFFQRVFGGGHPAPAPTPRPVRRAQPAP